MELSEFALRLALVFLPGIVATHIITMFTTRRRLSPFTFVLNSFVLGILSYGLYGLLLYILCLFFKDVSITVHFLRALANTNGEVFFGEVFAATGCSVIVAVVLTYVDTYKLHFRVAQFLRITKMFGERDVWDYVFNTPDPGWITVRDLEHDLMYDGWYWAYSSNAEPRELLLKDVSVYKNGTGDRLYQVGAAYIPLNASFRLEFRSVPMSSELIWKEPEDAQGKGPTDEARGTPQRRDGEERGHKS